MAASLARRLRDEAAHLRQPGDLAPLPPVAPVDEDTILHDGVIFGLCDADLYVPVSDAAAGS